MPCFKYTQKYATALLSHASRIRKQRCPQSKELRANDELEFKYGGCRYLKSKLIHLFQAREGNLLFIVALTLLFVVLAGAVWLIARHEKKVYVQVSPPKEQPPRHGRLGLDMSWIAVKTNNPADVACILGLENAVHENWVQGVTTIYATQKSDTSILITPALDKWVLIAGHALPQPLGTNFTDKCTPLIISLSKEFGEAQYFMSYPSLDFFGWAKASNNHLIRAFATGDEGLIWNHGRLTTAELELGLKFYDFRGLSARNGDAGKSIILAPTQLQVLALASQWSVNPAALKKDISGHTTTGFIGQAPLAWRSERLARKAA